MADPSVPFSRNLVGKTLRLEFFIYSSIQQDSCRKTEKYLAHLLNKTSNLQVYSTTPMATGQVYCRRSRIRCGKIPAQKDFLRLGFHL